MFVTTYVTTGSFAHTREYERCQLLGTYGMLDDRGVSISVRMLIETGMDAGWATVLSSARLLAHGTTFFCVPPALARAKVSE